MAEGVVAVLLGGWSKEREVSLVSGHACAQALLEAGRQVEEVDAGRDLGAVLSELQPDVCLNMLHGQGGEDGCVQGLLETLLVPYSHSGVEASAVAMNKSLSKSIFQAAGLPVAESMLLPPERIARSHAMRPPYVVKPNNEGSSIGIEFVVEDAPPPDVAGREESLLMVERFVPGMELTVAVMDGRSLEITEIEAVDGGWYDYRAKYASGGSRHVLPARVAKPVRSKVLEYAALAHQVLGCRGVSRVDFRYDPEAEEIAVLEINTQPGMTPTSLVPEQAECVGIGFAELVEWMVEDASCPRRT